MTYRVSLRSTPSLRLVLILTILFSPYYIWRQYNLFNGFTIHVVEVFQYENLHDDWYTLWTRFLNVLAVNQPDGSTLKVDWVYRRFTEIQEGDDTSQCLDAAHLSEKSLEISRAALILISKRKHAATLLIATYYNLYGPKFYYRLLSQGALGEGDKDTLIAAADTLNATHYQVRERVMYIGYLGPYGYFTGTAMCQRHPGDDYARYLAAPEEGYRESPDTRIKFIHHSGVKLNLRDLLGQLDAGYRMWGSKEQTVGRFGFDFEAGLWKEILVVACQGRHRKRWDEKRKFCDGLKGFWDAILEKEGRYANLGRAVA
jgi:hypothetical protein